MEMRQVIGLAGSLILFLGVFAPIVSLPIVGSMNYFQNGEGDGIILIAIAILSLGAVITKTYKGLWLTGLGALGLLAYTFIEFRSRMSEVESQMETQLAGNPFRGLADMAVQSVQLQWGWALLVVGAVLLLVAAGVGSGSTRATA